MSKIDGKAIWAEVQENHRKLRGCALHDFSIDLNPDRRMGKKWQCSRCGGVIDAVRRLWYIDGLKHGRAHPQE